MKCQIGDHIVTKKIGYTHHGIYIGNGAVIHHSGFAEPFKKGPIEKTSLQSFSGGKDIFKYPNESLLKGDKFHPKEIVARAEKAMKENETYNLLFNNCEHFANWCTHNDSFSPQTSGTAVKNIRKGNLLQAGGLTIFDAIKPLELFKKRKK